MVGFIDIPEPKKQGGTSLPAPELSEDTPLMPFEQEQLDRLIVQIRSTPIRIQRALVEAIFPTSAS